MPCSARPAATRSPNLEGLRPLYAPFLLQSQYDNAELVAKGSSSPFSTYACTMDINASENGAAVSAHLVEENQVVGYILDEMGNPVALKDGEESAAITYDDEGRPQTITWSDDQVETYSYDGSGGFTVESKSGKTSSTRTYNADGTPALHQERRADGTLNMEYRYDHGILQGYTQYDEEGSVLGDVTITDQRNEAGAIVAQTVSFSSTVFDIDYTYDEHGNLASSKMLAYISNYDEPMFAQEWTYEYAWIEQPTELVRMYRSPLPIMLYYGRTIRRMALVATATASATSSVMVTSSGSSSDIMPSARSTPSIQSKRPRQ